MRPLLPSSRAYHSTHSVDRGALVGATMPAPRHLCGPVPEPFAVLPRPVRMVPAPVVTGTVPDWYLQPLSVEARKVARCKVARYSSPVPLLWDPETCNLVEDKATVKAMKHPAINAPCGPIKLHDSQREQARLALRAIRAMLWKAV